MTEITFHFAQTSWWRPPFTLVWRFMMKMRLLSSWWFVEENTFHVGEVTFEGDYLSCWAGDPWWGRWCVCRTFWSWHGKCLRSHPRDLCAATALLLTCSRPKALQRKILLCFKAAFSSAFDMQLSKSPAKQNTFYFGSRSHLCFCRAAVQKPCKAKHFLFWKPLSWSCFLN